MAEKSLTFQELMFAQMTDLAQQFRQLWESLKIVTDERILKLPNRFEDLKIVLHNCTGLGNMRFEQEAARYIVNEGCWMVNVYLYRVDDPKDNLRLVRGNGKIA